MTKTPDCNTCKISFDMGRQETASASQKIEASTGFAEWKGGTLKKSFPPSTDWIEAGFQI